MALTLEHSVLLALFQNRPELGLELMRDVLGESTDAGGPGQIESVDLTAAVPAEYRADLVVRHSAGRSPLVVIVEVQLERDREKRFSWPVYSVLLRARFRCDVQLLVFAPRAKVARWCARSILLGNGATFTPLVVGPESIPVITDLELALRAPELAVLSAMVHGRGDALRAASIGLAGIRAAESLERERGMLYFDLIRSALGPAARKAIEAMIPQGYKFKSDFARKYMAKGRALGEAEGRALGEANALLLVLEARGVVVAHEQRERILACSNLVLLDRWLRRAPTVATTDELFD
ncbi:MAG TPA: hypothetical protein VGI10_13925 [Polyangiaceae bacterium]